MKHKHLPLAAFMIIFIIFLSLCVHSSAEPSTEPVSGTVVNESTTEAAEQASTRQPLPPIDENEIQTPTVIGGGILSGQSAPPSILGITEWIVLAILSAVIVAVLLSLRDGKTKHTGKKRYTYGVPAKRRKRLLDDSYYK